MVSREPSPNELRAAWVNVIRRLQQVSLRSSGLCIMSIKFLINEQGEPIQWTEPEVIALEPKNAKQTILRLFGK